MVFFGHLLMYAVKFIVYIAVVVLGCKLGVKLHDNKKAKEAAVAAVKPDAAE